ncbi:MAG: glucosaminidase domain-containing protein [Pseudomonadales bacterium]
MTRFLAPLLVAVACLAAALLLASRRLEDREPLPDFAQWPAGEIRKREFFDFLRPLLEAENDRIMQLRVRLARIASRLPEQPPDRRDRRWLDELARDYAVDKGALPLPQLLEELLVRVDAVPVSLGLAQAAKESGWGTSRFAVKGNALFGQRCFDAGCGLVPEARRAGLRHEVRSFRTPAAAVASYVRNLNSHPYYALLRQRRAELRAEGRRVTGYALAQSLHTYSERSDDYVDEVRQLIRYNGLGRDTGVAR